jgi:hypothetical protein
MRHVGFHEDFCQRNGGNFPFQNDKTLTVESLTFPKAESVHF